MPTCEFPIRSGQHGEVCGNEADFELFIGADGKHWLYLCKQHRPSFEETQ